MELATLRSRITSLCVSTPFFWAPAVDPFSFERQPSGQIDQVFRVEVAPGEVLGGFNFLEERTDEIVIWLARKQLPDADATYTQLVTDISSLRAAVIHDGATTSGEYCVVDSNDFELSHEAGQEYAIARLAVPVNYELTV